MLDMLLKDLVNLAGLQGGMRGGRVEASLAPLICKPVKIINEGILFAEFFNLQL